MAKINVGILEKKLTYSFPVLYIWVWLHLQEVSERYQSEKIYKKTYKQYRRCSPIHFEKHCTSLMPYKERIGKILPIFDVHRIQFVPQAWPWRAGILLCYAVVLLFQHLEICLQAE